MCGIIAAISHRDVAPILLEGLKRLEYRGYDSAGMAICYPDYGIRCVRAVGKVHALATSLEKTSLAGHIGIAHTRWATHGKPSLANAHPHVSHNTVALIHNGIIENYLALKEMLLKRNYRFDSQTDTEVAAHLIHADYQEHGDMLSTLCRVGQQLVGMFSFAVLNHQEPNTLWAIRSGSPLVVGLGDNECFIASDAYALSPLVSHLICLEEGDIVALSVDGYRIYGCQGHLVKREVRPAVHLADSGDRGTYRHYMLKEIHEQPAMVDALLDRYASLSDVLTSLQCKKQGHSDLSKFDHIRMIHIIACGSSYHAGLVGRHWLEHSIGIPCQVEVASEYRYRNIVVPENTLFIAISQSGETADILAALRHAKQQPYAIFLSLCNVLDSTLVRESELVFQTHAGLEIGVASTKAFTMQLLSLLLFTAAMGQRRQKIEMPDIFLRALKGLPEQMTETLALGASIQRIAPYFLDKKSALFLGRGIQYPIAMEGSLKLKEISYIHAEAYPAGELKHGPLALLEANMPVVIMMPQDHLVEKLRSNINEIKARDGEVILLADQRLIETQKQNSHIITMPPIDTLLSPLLYTIPLQLLAYHVALLKGTDVDQPRHLAKSVTVE